MRTIFIPINASPDNDVIDPNIVRTVQISDGAGDLKDTVVSPSRQTEFVDGAFKLSRSNGALCSEKP